MACPVKFSDDGSTYFYRGQASKQEQTVLYRDGMEVGRGDSIPQFASSPDGKRFAYLYRDKSRMVNDACPLMLDGRRIGTATPKDKTLVFTPDGKHLISMLDADRKRAVQVDGKTVLNLAPTRGLLADEMFSFDQNGTLLAFGEMDGKLVKIELEFKNK